jgi:hypothetical protein
MRLLYVLLLLFELASCLPRKRGESDHPESKDPSAVLRQLRQKLEWNRVRGVELLYQRLNPFDEGTTAEQLEYYYDFKLIIPRAQGVGLSQVLDRTVVGDAKSAGSLHWRILFTLMDGEEVSIYLNSSGQTGLVAGRPVSFKGPELFNWVTGFTGCFD